MLTSMTGHGEAVAENDSVRVLTEIRSVNNRFLKVAISGELDASTQSRIESLIRRHVQRGTVSVRIQLQMLSGKAQYKINTEQLISYSDQLKPLTNMDDLAAFLDLPGVVQECEETENLEVAWPVVESAVEQAIGKLVEMRNQEGHAMLNDLNENCDLLADNLDCVKAVAPTIVDDYSARITDRINRLLQDHDVSVSPSDLLKEVGIFAEKIDVSEEIVRLTSHIEQFRSIADDHQSNGRKLDFLIQEMLRETNTIGSKANNADVANHVVEMKTIIERMREMIQNIE